MNNKKGSLKWHTRYMRLCVEIAAWSKHPVYKIGAIAVGNFGQILSTGYNGWPRGMVDEEDGRQKSNELGFSYTIHAEANLVCNANLTSISLLGSTVYISTLFPCLECSKLLIQVGVAEIVFPKVALQFGGIYPEKSKWLQNWNKTQRMLIETGLVITQI